mgnify:CR=1 FL=1
MSKKLDEYVDEALENIRNDRKITRELLDDAIKWLSKDESRHREIGITMSKYVTKAFQKKTWKTSIVQYHRRKINVNS